MKRVTLAQICRRLTPPAKKRGKVQRYVAIPKFNWGDWRKKERLGREWRGVYP